MDVVDDFLYRALAATVASQPDMLARVDVDPGGSRLPGSLGPRRRLGHERGEEEGGGRGGAKAGEPAPEFFEITIDEVIAEAEDAEEAGAARVDVTWPEGSDYPTEVYIDRDERMADEEIGYTLSDVKVLGEGVGG